MAINSSKKKLVNNLAVLTNTAPSYAPEGKHLISVSINGKNNLADEELVKKVRDELEQWFGKAVRGWQFLKSMKIDRALPIQDHVQNELHLEEMKIGEHHYQCGDFLLNGSINGALKSGRLLAEFLLKEEQ